MDKIILTLKGVLLWTTMTAIVFFVGSIDSIMDNTVNFIVDLSGIAIMTYSCIKLITEEEFEILSLSRWLNNKLRNE